jgi:hypothetical protein
LKHPYSFLQLLLYLIENYPTKLHKVNLEENNINSKLQKSIKSSLLDVETESEMSEKSQESSEYMSDSKESSDAESESAEESSDDTQKSEVKPTKVKVTSVAVSPNKSTMKSEIPVKSDEVIKLESTWDGEELIEITEPPIVHDTSSFSSLQNLGGVNLGQVVSVSIGKGSVPDLEHSDEELKEVKLVSIC